MIVFDKMGIRKKIIYKLKGGLLFAARGQSTDINEMVSILSDLIYPPEFIKLNKDDVVVDLGASCGEFVLYVKKTNKKIQLKGYAVEPYKKNIDALTENLTLNKITDFIVVPFAISDTNKDVYLNINTSFDGVNITGKKTSTKVSALTFESIMKKYNIKKINLLKVDIEGHEYEVFKKSYNTIKRITSKILLEYHNLTEKKEVSTLVRLFKKDYKITYAVKASSGGILCLVSRKVT